MQIIGAESGIADRIMRDPSVIEEVLRITDREKWKQSGQSTCMVLPKTTPVITEIKRSQPTPFAVFQLKAYVLRPSAPAHGACEGLQDTCAHQPYYP